MKDMSEIEVSEEFIEENQCQSMPKGRAGPWTQHDKEARREEVYRLHFDYSFSARKIADLMKVSRNTVNSDLRHWYSIIAANSTRVDPEIIVGITLTRLDIQYARLREQLDKTDSQQERNTIERLMLDVTSKSIHTNQKMAESFMRVIDQTTKCLNNHMIENRKDTRYISMHDRRKVSSSAHKKIEHIIKEDQMRGDPDFN
jgi:DNA-binding CsgD family transcriptional regulator